MSSLPLDGDNSLAPGTGRRLDGWPNRDLNVGAVVSLAPNPDLLTYGSQPADIVEAGAGRARTNTCPIFSHGPSGSPDFRPSPPVACAAIPVRFRWGGRSMTDERTFHR